MLCTSLGTIEVPHSVAQSPFELTHLLAAPGAPDSGNRGSVEHHHLDDLPTTLISESSAEPVDTAPPVSGVVDQVPSVVAGRICPYTSPESPVPTGLLRPPRSYNAA